MVTIRKNVSNLLGWRTKRKLVVIESDDWGSIRTKGKEEYERMLKKGINVDKSNFSKFDVLESNNDLQRLYNLLLSVKDHKDNHPVFTPMCIVANPDFDKIKNNNFESYFYESFTETCKRYPDHDKVQKYWLDGINNKIFEPQFHGREHLNVKGWMRAIQTNNEGLMIAFDNQSIGIDAYHGQKVPRHLAAFDPIDKTEILSYFEIIESGCKLFEKICGYTPRYFVASKSSEPKILERELKKSGIKYLTRYKLQKYPTGDGTYTYEINWLGKRNKLDQIILTRNCGFEPSDFSNNNNVDNCLAEIQNAFFWNKPAIISTHRVNYVGGISMTNADHGLKSLRDLLIQMLKKWPEIEFITAPQLGEIISKNEKEVITDRN